MRVARADAVQAWVMPGQAEDILPRRDWEMRYAVDAKSSSSKGRWRVAVQDLPVGTIRRGGAVRVQDDLPVPPVYANVVVKLAQENTRANTRLAAVFLVHDVVDVAVAGGAAAVRPGAVLVAHGDGAADVRRDGF